MLDRSQHDVPVLVVGAGPSGLMMAAELARHGVSCRIVDKAPAPTTLSKATGMQTRTLEIMAGLGLLDEILHHGHVSHGVSVYAGGRRLMHFSYDDLDSPYPFIVSIRQSETERILGQHVARLGVKVEREVELVAFTPDADRVKATLRHRDGHEETVDVGWLVGCDGAHSTVRHTLNIPFEGQTFTEWFALADVKLHWALPDDELRGFVHPKGLLFVIPYGNGEYRLILEEAEHSGGEPTLEDFQAAMDERGPGGTVSDPGWITGFHVNARRAGHQRVGRVFLAGDAAHVHSPAGGQGLNTSIQDAYNLAWKLALVVNGHGHASLLDSYEAERAPVAAAVIQMTGMFTRVLTTHNVAAQTLRNRLMPLLAGSIAVQQHVSEEAAELDITYRKSPIVGEHHDGRFGHGRFAGGPKPGYRAPDAGPLRRSNGATARLFDIFRGTEHVLLLFGGAAPTTATWRHLEDIREAVSGRYAEVIRTYLISPGETEPENLTGSGALLRDVEENAHRRYQADTPSLYLVRPDGYIGFRSRPADLPSLQRHLDQMLTARGTAVV